MTQNRQRNAEGKLLNVSLTLHVSEATRTQHCSLGHSSANVLRSNFNFLGCVWNCRRGSSDHDKKCDQLLIMEKKFNRNKNGWFRTTTTDQVLSESGLVAWHGSGECK